MNPLAKFVILSIAGITLSACANEDAVNAYVEGRIAQIEHCALNFSDPYCKAKRASRNRTAQQFAGTQDGHLSVQPNAYGMGVGMDQYGRAIKHHPLWQGERTGIFSPCGVTGMENGCY